MIEKLPKQAFFLSLKAREHDTFLSKTFIADTKSTGSEKMGEAIVRSSVVLYRTRN